jgi:hypothetical protein
MQSHFAPWTHRNALCDLQVHRLEKHKFGIMCPRTLFVVSVPVPPEHEKECDHVSHPGCIEVHYVTDRSNKMQKHKFDVTCPGALLMETAPGPPQHEK